MLKILVITKRQYMGKDLLDHRFGRFREIPLALGKKGYKVQGICLSYADKGEELIQDGPVNWKSINATSLKLPGLIRFFREAQLLAKKSDVIWACSDSLYGIIGYMLSLKFRIPLVFDLYDNFEYYAMARFPLIKKLFLLAVRKSDAITCVSRPLLGLVNSYGRKNNIFILENAVRKDLFMPMDKKETRDSLKLPQGVSLVGTAGALAHNRGIQFLFDAFDLLKSKDPNIHLALAGPRNLNIPIDDRIHDLGILPLEKVPLFFNALDVAVICNRENDFGKYCFPQKAKEIMACNVPLIAARIGSMAELYKDHPEWLFSPDDAADLALVLNNRLQDRSTDYGDVPSWSDVTKELEKIFLASQRRKRIQK